MEGSGCFREITGKSRGGQTASRKKRDFKAWNNMNIWQFFAKQGKMQYGKPWFFTENSQIMPKMNRTS